MKKKLLTLFCALALLCGLMPAQAAPAATTAHATAWLREVYVDGQRSIFTSAQGYYTYQFSYHGSIYMPANTAAQWLGCKLVVNQAEKTATFTSGEKPQIPGPSSNPKTSGEEANRESDRLDRYFEQGVDIQPLTDFTVLVDGKPWTFTGGGTTLDPFFVDGTLYLPVRAVGERMGKYVILVPAPDRGPFYTEEVISIDEAATPAQLAEMQAYLDQCMKLYWQAIAVVKGLADADTMTADQVAKKVEQIKSILTQIGAVPQPTYTYLHKYPIVDKRVDGLFGYNTLDEWIRAFKAGEKTYKGAKIELIKSLNATIKSRHTNIYEAQQGLDVLVAALGGK